MILHECTGVCILLCFWEYCVFKILDFKINSNQGWAVYSQFKNCFYSISIISCGQAWCACGG